MSSNLRKCISLSPDGMRQPGSAHDYRSNRSFFYETQTRWLKLWVYWPELQPQAAYAPGVTPPNYPPEKQKPDFLLQQLDAQITQANLDYAAGWGPRIILTIWGFPDWTNIQNRADNDSHGKTTTMCFPDSLDVNSPWGRFVAFLLTRYAYQGQNPHIQALEIVNEPNGQCWPQQNSSGFAVAQCSVGQMFQTASALNAWAARQIYLMGPATIDLRDNSPTKTDFFDFTSALLSYLQSYNFQDPTFFWTHHPYAETRDQPPLPLPTAQLRNMLVGHWVGAGQDPNHPQVFCTEGGVQRATLSGATDALQADRLRTEMNRLHNDINGQGLDITMFANYLFYTDVPSQDTGLRHAAPPAGDGFSRPAYADPWATFPGVD